MKLTNNSDRAWALSITLALALTLASSALFAFSFEAAQSTSVTPGLRAPSQPMVTCGGPIRVEASNSGNDANYATLALAFAAINAGTHTGTISIGVCASVTDTAVATLNASGTGSASYTSVVLTPAGGAPRTLTGAIGPGGPLIDLNGADNVLIDGLNTGGNSLTISNTTVSATAGTSTIRLINGASSNTITGCTVLGSSTSSTGSAAGNILISTSTGGANNGNTISSNAVGPAGANLPTKGIMSLGSASPNHNTGNIITNNNVFDFFSPTLSVAGIDLQSNTATTTVSNNRVYQTAPRVFTGTGLKYSGILMTTNGFNQTITGNVVGFGAANGTGTTSISGSTNLFLGLDLTNGSTTTATSVQGNTVSGIVQSTANTGSGSGSAFRGIFLAAGRYDVGTTTGNSVGSLDGSSTITFTESSTGGFAGIYDFTSSSNSISNNNIGAITINGTGTGTGIGGFRGIVFNTSSAAINTAIGNTIGASGAGAITDSLVGGYGMYGIQNSLGVITATGNTVRNMSGNSNAAATVVGSGMVLTSPSTNGGPNLISQNVIHSLSNNSGAASNSIYALYCSFPATTANVVERNVVHSLSITSTTTTSQLAGIIPAAGQGTYKNNMVRLGVDAAGASISTGYQIYGMFEIAGVNNLYFNSVYLGGTAVTDASTTFGFVSNVTSGTRNYINNIFNNARSNGAGTGKHYAIALSGITGVTSNRNDLYASGTGGFVGLSPGNIDQLTLANWQAATSQDGNSISVDPQFLDPNGTARPGFGVTNEVEVVDALVNLHIAGTSPCVNAGITIPSVTIDIDGQLRSPTPDVGADQETAWTGANVALTKTADASPVSFPNQIGFIVKLNNIYAVTATGLSVTDALPDPSGSLSWSIDAGATDAGWSITGSPPTQTLVYAPATLAGNTMTQAHVVTTTSFAKCGLTINNSASFTSSNGGSGNASASILIVGFPSVPFSDAFDSVVAPTLPAGWVAVNAIGAGPLWVTTTTTPDTAPNAAFVDDPATVSDKRLDSPPIGIQTANAQVTFRNNYNLESTFDGGVLEISVGGGAFTDILAAGGSFVTGGYNATLSTNTSFLNPLVGRAAWSGTSTGPYLTTTAKLPAAAAGQSVVLRWRMGSDNTSAGVSWRIDGVSVSDFPCIDGPTPTPAPPTPTPTPTPTPGPPTPTPTPTPATPTPTPTTPTPTPGPPTPTPNGKIVFSKYSLSVVPPTPTPFEEHYEIYMMDSNGANRQALTSSGTDRPSKTTPNWSPDGTKVVYLWTPFVPPFDNSLHVLSLGGGDIDLGVNAGQVPEPAWSPDGTKIAYNRGNILVVNANGSNPVDLGQSGLHPSWSPDQTRIAFSRSGSIWVMNANGSNPIDLTGNQSNEEPAWSNDGTRISFSTTRHGTSEIYVMNADGTNQVRLTNNTAYDAWPTWSPDSGEIAFESARDGYSQIYVMNADGSNQHRISNGTFPDRQPNWQRILGSPSPTPTATPACPPITVNPATLPNGAIGGSFYSQSITASGGSAPYTFTVISGTLPSGLTLTTGGSLTGFPMVPGSFNFTIRATASDNCTGVRSYTITIGLPPPTPTPTPTPSPTPTPAPTPTSTPTPSPTPESINISGTVSYCSNPAHGPVPGVTLTVTGDGSTSTLSDSSGNYQFSFAFGGSHTVTPSKSDLLPGTPGPGGINTVDAIATQRYFLGFATPLTGCRLTAGDVNGVNGVNTVDAIAMQRFFLGQTTGTANVGKYQFIPASRSYSSVPIDQTGQNFDTLVLGDVVNAYVH